MPRIREQCVQLLAMKGVENPQYRTEKVKRKLRAHFGQQLVFYQPPSRSEACLVHAPDLPLFRVIQLMEQQNGSPTELRQDDSSQSDVDVAEVG